MADIHSLVFTFLFVTLLREGVTATDEGFQHPSLVSVTKMMAEMKREMMKDMEREMTKKIRVEIMEEVNEEIQGLSRRVTELEVALNTDDRKLKPEMMDSEMVQNSTLEERVSLLEVQVSDMREDITEVEEDVTGLVENVNFLFDEQIIDDQRLFNLESTTDQVIVELAQINENLDDLGTTTVALDFRVTALENNGEDGNSSVADLEVRVEALEETTVDQETRIVEAENNIEDLETRLPSAEENIQGLQQTDINHDSRISALEENGGGSGGSQNETIAFYAVLTSYDTISTNTPIMFNEVVLNEGDGYDSTAGTFTIPPGGDGVYYFSIYILVDNGEYANVNMRLNDDVICSTQPDHHFEGANDWVPGSCSAIVDVIEGDEIDVVVTSASDNTPLVESTSWYYNGFNGFRI